MTSFSSHSLLNCLKKYEQVYYIGSWNNIIITIPLLLIYYSWLLYVNNGLGLPTLLVHIDLVDVFNIRQMKLLLWAPVVTIVHAIPILQQVLLITIYRHMPIMAVMVCLLPKSLIPHRIFFSGEYFLIFNSRKCDICIITEQ